MRFPLTVVPMALTASVATCVSHHGHSAGSSHAQALLAAENGTSSSSHWSVSTAQRGWRKSR